MDQSRVKTLEARVQAIQEIAVELMSARDNSSLLNLIVDKATELSSADAAALFLRKDADHLEFVIARNRSHDYSFERQTIRIQGHSIAAHVFNTRNTLHIKDAYSIPKEAPYRFDRSFDEKTGYQTRAIIAVPLVTSKGDTLGVIQILNKISGGHFSDEEVQLVQGFAALASASIEKTSLYEDIQRIFEGFLHASVKVIDERDPATRGHSERVALLTRTLGEKCNGQVPGVKLSETQLRELYFASLLHDFGKIGVSERVLLKPEKLFPEQLLTIQNRLLKLELQAQEKTTWDVLHQLMLQDRVPNELDLRKTELRFEEIRGQFDGIRELIQRLNQPQVLNADLTAQIEHLKGSNFVNEAELSVLSIPRGSLTKEEKQEIDAHVTKTYRFLSEIPWTKDFTQLAEIAYGHHEKLDGSGYPRKLKGSDIPVQARMMAISDIYDALVAADRPYKAALPREKALDILHMEAKAGKLDPALLAIFVQARVFDTVAAMLTPVPHKQSA